MKYFYKEKEIRNKNDWKKAFCSAYSGTSDDYHWKEGVLNVWQKILWGKMLREKRPWLIW